MAFLGVGSFGPQSGISVPDMFGAGGPSQGLDQNPWEYGLKSEASRESAAVIMNHINLVEILMDVLSRSYLSPCTAVVHISFLPICSLLGLHIDVLSTGVAGNYNGAFQVEIIMELYKCMIPLYTDTEEGHRAV
ncbi:hypothetical protein POM88_039876 [Heracleum sosnowskyi]|uniref:Uncharacterized protein n=1 Tax=Heracleum sosnowskyi TaxID=360622 RepID=A0AAD8HDX5_9APIA|nr:hypothetical protein POM88_039876 [Heracleum sosnowskyi]